MHLTANLPRNIPVKIFLNRLRFDRIIWSWVCGPVFWPIPYIKLTPSYVVLCTLSYMRWKVLLFTDRCLRRTNTDLSGIPSVRGGRDINRSATGWTHDLEASQNSRIWSNAATPPMSGIVAKSAFDRLPDRQHRSTPGHGTFYARATSRSKS